MKNNTEIEMYLANFLIHLFKKELIDEDFIFLAEAQSYVENNPLESSTELFKEDYAKREAFKGLLGDRMGDVVLNMLPSESKNGIKNAEYSFFKAIKGNLSYEFDLLFDKMYSSKNDN